MNHIIKTQFKMKEYLEDLVINILLVLAILVIILLCIYVIIGLSIEIYNFFNSTKEICLGGHYSYRNVKIRNTYQLQKFFVCDSAKIIY
jgi:hypothetical protein